MTNVPIIVLTSLYDQNMVVEAARSGIENYIVKSPEKYEKIAENIIFFIERWKTQQNQIKIQKYELLETISRGLAHDFKNILMGILGNVTIIKFTLKENELQHVDPFFEDVEQSIFQATDICNNLMNFTREEMFQFESEFSLKETLATIAKRKGVNNRS